MMPDYSLYPEWDSDLGFTTRGCRRNCFFCSVPEKEGKFRIHQHPQEFHDPYHRSIVLMDNNILFDKDWFLTITDWIMDQRMAVDFNQGLDLRLVDREIATRLKSLRPMDSWHFAFDNLNYQDAVITGINTLKKAGVDVRHRCNVYVYMHDDNDYDSALERCRILRDLGTLPYIMVNRESFRTQRMTDLKRWTRPQIFFSAGFEDYNRSIKRSTEVVE